MNPWTGPSYGVVTYRETICPTPSSRYLRCWMCSRSIEVDLIKKLLRRGFTPSACQKHWGEQQYYKPTIFDDIDDANETLSVLPPCQTPPSLVHFGASFASESVSGANLLQTVTFLEPFRVHFPWDILCEIIEQADRPALLNLAVMSRGLHTRARRQLYRSVTLTDRLQSKRFTRAIVENVMSRKARRDGLQRPLEDDIQHLHLALECPYWESEAALSHLGFLILLFGNLRSLTFTLYEWSPYLLYNIIGQQVGHSVRPSVKRVTLIVRTAVAFSLGDVFITSLGREHPALLARQRRQRRGR